jgi:ribosomal protein L32
MESSQRLRHYRTTIIFQPLCWRARRPDFYRVHQKIRTPSTNPDRNLAGSKDRHHISLSTGYYRSPNFFLKDYHIQFKKITTYEIKWLIEHTTKCWARLSTYCCIPLWQSWFRTCVSTNNSIGLGSRPRDVACKEKKIAS